MNTPTTTIRVINPDLVEIHEVTETYRMTRADVEQAIANVKERRHKYASDAAYLRRLNHFEEILATFKNGRAQ